MKKPKKAPKKEIFLELNWKKIWRELEDMDDDNALMSFEEQRKHIEILVQKEIGRCLNKPKKPLGTYWVCKYCGHMRKDIFLGGCGKCGKGKPRKKK